MFFEKERAREREMLNVSSRHGVYGKHPPRRSQHTSHTASNPIYPFIGQGGKKRRLIFFCSPLSSSGSTTPFPPVFFFFYSSPPKASCGLLHLTKKFHKTTASGASLSPPQRRPPPCSARSIARVFIRNVMCRVRRSSSLRL